MRLLQLAAMLTVMQAAGQVPPALTPDQPIVVGLLSNLKLEVSQGQATAQARLTVARAIAGALPAGAQVSLSWSFRWHPQLQPEQVLKSAPAYGLLRLLPLPHGGYQPQPVESRMPHLLGGAILPLPDGPTPPEYALPANAPSEARLAAELASALSAQLLAMGEPVTSTGGRREADGGWGYGLSGDSARFGNTTRWLVSLDPATAVPVFRQLLSSASPSLRAAGVAALLRVADAEALRTLERDAPQLARTIAAYSFGASLLNAPPKELNRLSATIGRLALLDAELPSFEPAAISILGRSSDIHALPYLAALLESPYNATRAMTVMNLCTFVRGYQAPGAKSPSLWQPAFQEHCPNTYPLPRPADEPLYTSFWRNWYANVRAGLQLPAVPLPSRFRDSAITDAPEPEVSLEVRLNAWAHSLLTREQYLLKNPPPNGPASDFAGRLTNDEESLVLSLIHNLDTEMQRLKREVMDSAQRQGAMPPAVVIEQADRTRRELLAGALQELKRKLSDKGWAVVHRELMSIAIRIHPAGALPPWD